MATVLIIDDSPVIRKELKKCLETAGHSVIEALDGLDGYNAYTTNEFDICFCDVNMPHLDGLSMSEKIKKDNGTLNIPLVFLTTECSSEMKARGKACGVKAWITKPFNVESILKAVANFTSNKI